MNNIYLKVSEPQKMLLNCLLYNELMKLEDRILYPSFTIEELKEREEIVIEILDIKNLLGQIRGE